MNKTVHHLGLDVHKETIAVSIAPAGTAEVRRYGIIGGSLDAVDKLLPLRERRGTGNGRPVSVTRVMTALRKALAQAV